MTRESKKAQLACQGRVAEVARAPLCPLNLPCVAVCDQLLQASAPRIRLPQASLLHPLCGSVRRSGTAAGGGGLAQGACSSGGFAVGAAGSFGALRGPWGRPRGSWEQGEKVPQRSSQESSRTPRGCPGTRAALGPQLSWGPFLFPPSGKGTWGWFSSGWLGRALG